jgi:hypothetical protein
MDYLRKKPMSRCVNLAFTLPILLSGCSSGGSNPALFPNAPAPQAVETASTKPAGVSVSSAAESDSQGNVSVDDYTIDSDFTLATVGTIGRYGTTGNVTKVTTTGINTAIGGSTQTITHGSGDEVIENGADYVMAFSDSEAPEWLRSKVMSFATSSAEPTAPGDISGSSASPYQASYLTFGGWSNCSPLCQPSVSAGIFVFGDATQPNNIPSIGKATYSGFARGLANDQEYEQFAGGSSQEWYSQANMKAEANFSTRTIELSTTGTVVPVTNMDTNVTNVVSTPQLDMAGTLSYTSSVNLFSGTVADAGGRSGTATGRFYGPAADEIGGVYALGTPDNGHIGFFVGRK